MLYWDLVYLSHNGIGYLCCGILTVLTIFLVSISLYKQNISFAPEYIFFVLVVMISGYLLISSTNFFFAIFMLEFIALLIFGKFVVSRILYKQNLSQSTKNVFLPQFSFGLFNSLFFQFWANFISSILLFFSLINLHYIFGFSNFFFLNFFFSILSCTYYIHNFSSMFIIMILFTGFIIKLGLSPYQFFKIETYKGIPLFMVVVYTTLYLLIYVYFFIYLYVYQIPAMRDFTNMYIAVVLVVSILYLVNLLFDTKNFKAFLSYSTLITLINIFVSIILV